MRAHLMSGLMLVVEALIVLVCSAAFVAAYSASVLTPVELPFMHD